MADQAVEEAVEDAQGLSSPTVYEIIAREGREEMERPARSLWFSGVVAGLAISMSLYVMAALRIELEGTGLEILEKSGYSVGFLVAVMVWMLPSSKHFEIWTITMMTFTIAILDTSHVIVGSAELFMVWLDGQSSFSAIAPRLILSALGNIIGGTVLFAVLAYAQVRAEM